MSSTSSFESEIKPSPVPWLSVRLFYVLAAVAIMYAFLAGLKTIAEFDLGWQMAIARWTIQHHQIPSTDVLSYTAAGQPWTYPIGAGLIFYGLFLVGGYALLSCMAAVACAAVVALLLRRGSAVSAAIAILAVPLIASRTTPRAELFTVVLFAATLSLLWQQHETGRARLWVLPPLMVAWVNLHPGFIAGLGLLGAYTMVEAIDMLQLDLRAEAMGRLRRAWPWLAATLATTLLNPWGWNVFRVIARQEAAMGAHSQLILEWAPIPMNWTHIRNGLSWRNLDEFYVLFLVVALAVAVAVLRRQYGAAILIAVATFEAIQHTRFVALFSVVLVIVGGAVLTPCVGVLKRNIADGRLRVGIALAAALPFLVLATTRVANMVTDRTYLSGSNLVSFGAGLSWWFPQRAADFVEREDLPGQVFSSGSEGAYMAFRLGPKYKDYIDGRAIPFGTELMLRSARLKASPPDSPQWKQEVEHYGINVILLPIGRFGALQFFPVLKDFCESELWRPVYLDETSVVFLRRTPETEPLIQHLQIDCSTAPLPVPPVAATGIKGFNQWANAAGVLRALGRDAEAFAAANKALAIFPASGYLHFMRGHMYQEAGNMREAEQDYLLATKLEPTLVAPWSALAAFYQDTGRLPAAIDAWEHAAGVSRWPWDPLVSLGYADLQAHRPAQALAAFDGAANSLPARYDLMVDNRFLANIAHGRARSCFYLGDLRRAISFEEEATRLLPDDADVWLQLAELYDRAGRTYDANRTRAQVLRLSVAR
jgi:Flp pilus assembly protein TadD